MTLYERFSGSNLSSGFYFYEPYRNAQTFTVGSTGPHEDFYVKSGSVWIHRVNSPSDIWVYIQDTSDGHPNNYLTSGEIDVSDITTDSNGAWADVSFNSTPRLRAGEKYAITVTCSGSLSPPVYIVWTVSGSGGYTYGNREYSDDSGNTWTSYSQDFYFKIYGTKAVGPELPKQIRIYFSSLAAPHYIECPCTRWDSSDYTIVIETVLDKNDRDTLFNHITPGAVGELYKILGRPYFYDKTWTGSNTLRLVPISGTGLASIRSEKIIYVKNYSETTLNPDFLAIKIEGYISGESL